MIGQRRDGRRTAPAGRAGRRAVLALLLLALGVPAAAQEVSYVGSVQAATGDYFFTERTNSVYFVNGLSVTAPRYTVSLSVPVIVQDAPWVSYGVAGALPSGGPQQAAVGGQHGGGGPGRRHDVVVVDTSSHREVGLGDPMLRAGLTLVPTRRGRPSLRLSAGLKPPLADVDRGFGTGAWDVGAGVSASAVVGRRLLFVDLMAWSLGDMEDLELRDALYYSVGIGQPLRGGRAGILATFAGATRIIDGTDPPLSAGLGLSYDALSAGVTVGLTDSSPDVAVTLGWRVPL